jgi:hypothetical protein
MMRDIHSTLPGYTAFATFWGTHEEDWGDENLRGGRPCSFTTSDMCPG